MSRTCDFAANWARFDADKRGNAAWGKIPNPHYRPNPLDLELPEGWSFEWSDRTYRFRSGSLEIGVTPSADGFFRFWWAFDGDVLTGHGVDSQYPNEWLKFLHKQERKARKYWRKEIAAKGGA